jgi:hypothetical protein
MTYQMLFRTFLWLNVKFISMIIWIFRNYRYGLMLGLFTLLIFFFDLLDIMIWSWVCFKQWPLDSEFVLCEFCECCEYSRTRFWRVSCWCCDSPDSPTFAKPCGADSPDSTTFTEPCCADSPDSPTLAKPCCADSPDSQKASSASFMQI